MAKQPTSEDMSERSGANRQQIARRWDSSSSSKAYGKGKSSPAVASVAAPAPQAGSVSELRFFLVMDFEATCWQGGQQTWQQEIIEFPAVLLDAVSLEPLAEFREFVKPTKNPQLSDFCTELTGIQQADVDDADHLPQVLQRFGAWLDSLGLGANPAAALPITCGDYDLGSMLRSETSQKGLEYHPSLWWWCNLKVPFAKCFGRPAGMKGMLGQLGLRLVGKHHSGIADARNIARILQALIQRHGAEIGATGGSPPRPVASASRLTAMATTQPAMPMFVHAKGAGEPAREAAREPARKPAREPEASVPSSKQGDPEAAAMSAVSKEEKKFLKLARSVRALLKIEAQAASGAVDKLQEQKLAGKDEELMRLAEVASALETTSPLREKNADILALALACARA